MSEVETLLEEIRTELPQMQPAPETLYNISHVNMGLIIGPFGAGKNTLMDAMLAKDSDFGRVRSFTTREDNRPGEQSSTYVHLPHTPEGLTSILGDMRAGKIIQLAVFNTGRVYFSTEDSYASPYNVLDTMASAVSDMEALPFQSVTKIIVGTTEQSITRRMKERAKEIQGIGIDKRLEEAESSLVWSLEQGDKVAWVPNFDGGLDLAAIEAIGIIKGYFDPDPSHRVYGEYMLRAVRQLRS